MNVICTRNIRLPMQLIMKKSRKTFSNALKLKVDVNTVIYQEKYEEICVANTMSSYKTVFIKKPCNIKKKRKKKVLFKFYADQTPPPYNIGKR